jgi:hypothetical protein
MLLQVEKLDMKRAYTHRVIRNFPNFRERVLFRDEGINKGCGTPY